MHWCSEREKYVELDDCQDCYDSDECDYGYAKDPGEDDNCSYIGDECNGVYPCYLAEERSCNHRQVVKDDKGEEVIACGLMM